MFAKSKPISALCANDVMAHDVVMIPDQMSLQGAARILSRSQVSGAPVVDGDGRIVGVLSSFDFVHWAEKGGTPVALADCPEVAWKPWQMLDHPEHARTLVSEVMTANPVTASPRATVIELARMMIDAHIHRIVIVDADDKPVGIVSSTDLLAALAQINVDSVHEPVAQVAHGGAESHDY